MLLYKINFCQTFMRGKNVVSQFSTNLEKQVSSENGYKFPT